MARFALTTLALFGALAAGCGSSDWTGTYHTTGHWNLSGPLSDGRSAGDAIADLLIDEIAGAAPLPGDTQDDLAVALADLFRPKIRSFVDERAPAELRAGGSFTNLLAGSLADVMVETTLVLEEGGDGVEGTETFESFQLGRDPNAPKLRAAELGVVEIVAAWEGEAEDGRFEIEPHEVALQYGALVELAAKAVAETSELSTLEAGLLAALDCSLLVTELLDGQSEVVVDLGLLSFTVDADVIGSPCTSVRELVTEQALGLFSVGSMVEVGGLVSVADADGDLKHELANGEGFGGIVAIAPASLAPKVTVTFNAVQQ